MIFGSNVQFSSGAQVNVVGHINIFEAVKKLYEHNPIPIVYASSAAVAGFHTDYSNSIDDETPHLPRTHYGVFKLANEGIAYNSQHSS